MSPVDVRDTGDIERTITAFARESNGGLIVTSSALAIAHRELIITLAAQHKLIEKALLPHDPLAPSAHYCVRSSSQIRGDLARGIFRGAHMANWRPKRCPISFYGRQRVYFRKNAV